LARISGVAASVSQKNAPLLVPALDAAVILAGAILGLA
jgi:hypothetical protein